MELIVGKHYKISKKIGTGSFGDIFLGILNLYLPWLGKHT